MKKIAVLMVIVGFIGTLSAKTPYQKATGKTAPRVSQDKGKDKDKGKHAGEDKDHHRHHHHRHPGHGSKKK